jgi:hypothetical protein
LAIPLFARAPSEQQQGGRGEFTVLIGPRPTSAGDKRRGSRARRPQDFSDIALDDDDEAD